MDVPSLDGVAFIDPRSSQIDIIQAVGRAIRLSTNKQAGTIVLPVFIGKSDDSEQALEEGNFKPIPVRSMVTEPTQTKSQHLCC